MIFSFLEQVEMPERIEIGVTHWDSSFLVGNKIRIESLLEIADRLFKAGHFEYASKAYEAVAKPSMNPYKTEGFVDLPDGFMTLVTIEDCPKQILFVGDDAKKAALMTIPFDPEKHKS